MQIVYCTAWALLGVAASEHLRRLPALSTALAGGLPWLPSGTRVSAQELLQAPMFALAKLLVGAYQEGQRLLLTLAVPSAGAAFT
jgi:hypothetical protein